MPVISGALLCPLFCMRVDSIEHSALMNGKEDESALLLLVSQWNLVRVHFCLNLVPSHLVKRTAVNLSISAKKMPNAVNNFNNGRRRTILQISPTQWVPHGRNYGATTGN